MFLNQFKKVLENQGEVFQSYIIKAKVDNLELERLKNKKDKTIQDKMDEFVLYLNKYTNNHALSWLRVLCSFFPLTIIFYVLYLISINRFLINNEIECKLIGYYFEFINPTHRLDFLERKETLHGLTIFIDFFNRLIVGYLIYQFIAAFRKIGKK